MAALIQQMLGGGSTTNGPLAMGGGSSMTGGFMGGSGGMAPGNFTGGYTANPAPEMSGVLNKILGRYNEGFKLPPELAKQYSEDNTKRLIGMAGGRIGEAAAGQKSRAAEIAARGGGEVNARAIEEDRQRRTAGAAAGITADRAQAKDSLATTIGGMRQGWEQGRNSLLGMAGGVAGGIQGDRTAQMGNMMNASMAANQNATSLMSLLAGLFQ
jgi:ABC-type glycerol-3-phosphate transport system substrate-binding protein